MCCFAATPHPSAALTPSPMGKALGAAAPERQYGGVMHGGKAGRAIDDRPYIHAGGAVVDGEMTTPQSASLSAPLTRGAFGVRRKTEVRCGCGGGAGENRGKLFRNKRKMSESVLRLGKRCDTIEKEKKKRGAWKWKKIDAPGV